MLTLREDQAASPDRVDMMPDVEPPRHHPADFFDRVDVPRDGGSRGADDGEGPLALPPGKVAMASSRRPASIRPRRSVATRRTWLRPTPRIIAALSMET